MFSENTNLLVSHKNAQALQAASQQVTSFHPAHLATFWGATGTTSVSMKSCKVWLLCFKFSSWPKSVFFPEVIIVLQLAEQCIGQYPTNWPGLCRSAHRKTTTERRAWPPWQQPVPVLGRQLAD